MKTDQRKAGVILSYCYVFLETIASLLYVPVMLRLLGQSQYGVYTLVNSTVSYLSLLNLGLSSSYIRFYSRYKAEKAEAEVARLNGMFVLIFLVIGAMALLAGGGLVAQADSIFQGKLTIDEISTTKVLMTLMVLSIAASFPFTVFSAYIVSNERFIYQKLLNVFKAILNPLIVLPLLLIGYKAIAVVAVAAVLNLSVDISNVIFCKRKLNIKFDFKKFDKKLLRELMVFSSFIFINIIVDQINWNVDKTILGIMKGSIATAVYGLAAQVNTYYQTFSCAISTVFTPRVHKMISSGCSDLEISDLFIKVGRIQFVVLALMVSGITLFGKPFFNFWGGADYQDSYYIAILLIWPVTIPLIQNMGIEIQCAKNLHRFRSYVYLGMAITNVLISIPLCKIWGGVGCAIGTALSLIVGNGIIMNIFYQKRVGIDIVSFWKSISKLTVPMCVSVFVGILLFMFFDLNKIFYFILSILIYTLVYILCIWLWGFNQQEKQLFASFLRRIRGLKG